MPRRKQIDGQLSLDFSAMPEEKVVQKKIDRKKNCTYTRMHQNRKERLQRML